MIDVALVGAGTMGAHHAGTVGRSQSSRLAVVIDPDLARAEALAARWGARAATAVPRDVDVAIVASPATTHAMVARPLLDRGLALLIEKPLAVDARTARELAAGRVWVGFCERFLDAPSPAAGDRVEIVRTRPPGPRGGDVDVLLDLAQHDLDHLGRWFGRALLPSFEGRVERERVQGTVRLGSASAMATWARDAATTLRIHHLGATWIDRHPTPAPPADPLTLQWEAVVDALSGRPSPKLATGDDGAWAVAAAEALRGDAVKHSAPAWV